MSPVATRKYDKLDDEIVKEVERFIREEGMSPTFRELAAALQVPSENTILLYVRKLVMQGRLRHEPGKSRTIRLPRSAA